MTEIISRISLRPIERDISVSIIDGGFYDTPSYAKVYGRNPRPRHIHGNRVLAVFAAPDSHAKINGLKVNLSCYDTYDGYDGLISALNALPHSDILSISMAWREDNTEIKNLLLLKADKIIVPSSNGGPPYPSSYNAEYPDRIISCADTTPSNADFVIKPSSSWNGASYAVPAIARIIANGIEPKNDPRGNTVLNEFQITKRTSEMIASNTSEHTLKPIRCKKCNRLIDLTHFSKIKSETPRKCPYCGFFIDEP